MPMYEFRCRCGNYFDRFFTIEKRQARVKCTCGRFAKRAIRPTMVQRDFAPYTCPVSGKLIEGKAAHRENLAVTGCRVLESGEREQKMRWKEEANKQLDREIGETVEKAILSLPSSKREKLSSELDSGLTAEIERR